MKTQLLVVWFFSSLLSAQTVYKIVKPDGTILYTDTPQSGAEPMELDDYTKNVADPQPVPKPQIPQQEKPTIRYQVSIVSPKPEATLRDNLGNVTITASSSPTFKGQYRLTFDNQANWRNSSGTFKLTGVNRGAHTYHVDLIDNKGKSLASSPQQTLYLHQASVLINSN
ncbi:DUF4124 domain-containing protein [Alteromonas sp. C1M14]|uniref:DUF4124 domain-containing protein n=1 Tax=Alteromonas sp. C1M14 TaxID=2841567 RepID=UPI001C0A063B|nr:DUF4124 domain-containing protein [Alteromonas sp. C1M14]MBU2979513.1 DUF4124 domain-containing protein [Alteromonas sp. C1M14]